MAEQLRCEVERSASLATVRLHGSVRADTAPILRAAVLKTLTDEPAAVIIDVSAVTVDDLGLAVFPMLARAAAAWPGTKLIITRADPRLVRRLRATAAAYLLVIAASDDEARAAATKDTSPSMLREHLPSGPAAVTVARALVRRICEVSPVSDLVDEAELVISELVTNAMLHGLPPLSLTVSRRPKFLYLAVRDSNPAEPRIGGGDTTWPDGRNGGRGLMVVEALALAWGCTPTADGKVVWATMRSRNQYAG
jgi:anti-sigma regulatory factor (Ser/Thr protein kinase)/anti-anti-sigma regulatory factor